MKQPQHVLGRNPHALAPPPLFIVNFISGLHYDKVATITIPFLLHRGMTNSLLQNQTPAGEGGGHPPPIPTQISRQL